MGVKMDLMDMGNRAVNAKYTLQGLSAEEKNRALAAVADSLVKESEKILDANAIDVKNGEEKGMHPGMVDRLRLSEARIADMAEGLRSIARLPDYLLYFNAIIKTSYVKSVLLCNSQYAITRFSVVFPSDPPLPFSK